VAALSAPASRAPQFFELAASRFTDSETKGRREFFQQVGSVIGMRANRQDMRQVVKTASNSSGPASDWWRGATLDGLAEGVQAKGAEAVAALKESQDLFLKMFEQRPGPVAHAAVHLLAVVGLPKNSATVKTLTRAEATAADHHADTAARVDAIDLLALSNSAAEAPLFEKLIDAQEPDSVQIVAVRALNSMKGGEVGPILLAKWRGMTPLVRSEATNTLLRGGSDRTRLLLEAVKNGDVPTWQLDSYKPRLFMDRDPAVRDMARKLFEQSSAQREQALKQYQAALNLSGDAARGKEVFKRACTKCHQLDGVGVAVGPNLGTVRNHPESELLGDIIMPSKRIEEGYETYVVDLTSGETLDGIMSAQTSATITLRQEQKREVTIPRQDIRNMYASKVSMMPDGLEKQISIEQMADLLAFLKADR
jgi:putative heme-binding domain-containing protein